MQVTPSTSISIPPLTGYCKQPEGNRAYTIRFSSDNVLHAQAQVVFEGKITFHTVLWKVHILLKSRLVELLITQPSTFEVEIKKEETLKVYLNSKLLKAENQHYIQRLNCECLAGKEELLPLSANWFKEQENAAERQRFLLDIILKSKNHSENQIASSNAISILRTIPFPLSRCQLPSVNIPYANLSGISLENTNFTGANLEKVNFSNSDLNHAILANANVSGMQLGEFPHLPHDAEVMQAAILPDECHLISITNEYLYLWDFVHGSLIRKIHIFTQFPNTQKFDVIKQKWKTLKTNSEADMHIFMTYFLYFREFALSPNGQFLYVAHLGGIQIRQAHTLELVKAYPGVFEKGSAVYQILCSPDGRFLITNEINNFCIWTISEDEQQKIELKPLLKKGRKNIQHICCSNSLIALYHKEQSDVPCIEIVSIEDGKTIAYLLEKQVKKFLDQCFESNWFNHFLFSPNGRSLILNLKNQPWNGLPIPIVPPQSLICEWQWETGKMRRFLCEKDEAKQMHLLPDSQLLFSTKRGKICLFDLNRQEKTAVYVDLDIHEEPPIHSFLDQPNSELKSVSASNNGKFLIGLYSNQIMIWKKSHVENGRIPFFLHEIVDMSFSPDNQTLLIAHSGYSLRKYEARSGIFMQDVELNMPQPFPWKGGYGVTYFSPHARYLISKSSDKNDGSNLFTTEPYQNAVKLADRQEVRYSNCKILRVADEREISTSLPPSQVIAISADDIYLGMINEQENQLEIVNLSNQKLLTLPLPHRKDKSEKWSHLAISEKIFPKGYIAIATEKQVILWEMQGNFFNPIHTTKGSFNYTHNIYQLFFTKNSLFISTDIGDVIKIEIEEEKIIKKQIRQARNLGLIADRYRLSLAPKSLLMAGCTLFHEYKIDVWNIETGKILLNIEIPVRPLKIILSLDGKTLAAWAPPHFLYVWDMTQAEQGYTRLLWRMPRLLEAAQLNLDNIKNLSEENKAIFTQMDARLPLILKSLHVENCNCPYCKFKEQF